MTQLQVIARGNELYDNGIRAEVETEHNGKMLAVNVYTGEYFITDTDAEFIEKIRPVYNDRTHHMIRIGEKPIRIRRNRVRRILWHTFRPVEPTESDTR